MGHVHFTPRFRKYGGGRVERSPIRNSQLSNTAANPAAFSNTLAQSAHRARSGALAMMVSKRTMRRSKPVDPNGDRRGHIKDIVSIRQRPAAVEDRAVPVISGPGRTLVGQGRARPVALAIPDRRNRHVPAEV
jgi:hypothetical protein